MNFKKLMPYALVILLFTIVSVLYFNPVLKGEQLRQSDITQFKGMSKKIKDYRRATDKEPYWLDNAFGGMPAYQVSAYYPNDFIRYLDKTIRFLPRPADYLFLYFMSFFVLLLALKVGWRLAILGSLSFGFSTYLIIIFGAGHNAKAHAIGYMPLVLAGVLYIFKNRYLLGFILTSLAMALEIYASHPQMTYYLGFILLILGIVEAINRFKKQELSIFGKQVALIIIAMLLGIGVNASRLLAMKEYAAYSTRGKSELTLTPDGLKKEVNSGLDKAYITEYSYGVWETFNLIIPRFMGGGTVEELDENSNFYTLLENRAGRAIARENSKQVLTYWGTQPIVEAPAYIGVILVFLFLLGAFLVKGNLKYWLVSATVFSILLSWGKNLPILTNAFIDYVPLYNKFRAVSSIQVIAELCVPLLGVLGLKDFLSAERNIKDKEQALKKVFYILGGLTLFFALLGPYLFSFNGLRDAQYQQMPALAEALIQDRKDMLFSDSIRSFVLIGLTALSLLYFLRGKLKRDILILSLSGLILFDLVSIDIHYVNKDDFEYSRAVDKPFVKQKVNEEIQKDTTYYRVANLGGNLLNEARTSYFHNSIGGYHAAKMKRYQELFDYQIAKNNMEMLNMLNVKYFIIDEQRYEENPQANGNVWFVSQLNLVRSADEEIKALDSINSKKEAVLKTDDTLETKYRIDGTARIELQSHDLNKLVYSSDSKEPQFAVFSEIYYSEGWKAYIDGEEQPYYNVNYVLRGMPVPAGSHTITFKFLPEVIDKGRLVSLLSYAIIILLPLFWFFYSRAKTKQ